MTTIPRGACDCHVHVFGPFEQFPPDPSAPYAPALAPVEALGEMHRRVGVERVVVVQPSVYGADHACALDALGRLGPSARGVAVIAPDAAPDELSSLDRAGFRAVRLNFGAAGERDPDVMAARLTHAAGQVEHLGWHVQTFAPLQALSALRDVVTRLPTPLVIDHFGLPDLAAGPSQLAFRDLLGLVGTGRVYVKLSGAYILSSHAEWSDVAPFAEALISCDPSRLLWGSNWPHPGGGTGAPGGTTPTHSRASDEALALDRLAGWAGDRDVLERVLVHNPAHLFGFPG